MATMAMPSDGAALVPDGPERRAGRKRLPRPAVRDVRQRWRSVGETKEVGERAISGSMRWRSGAASLARRRVAAGLEEVLTDADLLTPRTCCQISAIRRCVVVAARSCAEGADCGRGRRRRSTLPLLDRGQGIEKVNDARHHVGGDTLLEKDRGPPYHFASAISGNHVGCQKLVGRAGVANKDHGRGGDVGQGTAQDRFDLRSSARKPRSFT